MFFHGEDAVADDLSPFIDAAPREEQKYFLATQQVDEARHAVFFNRFMHEVVERGDGTIAGALEATRPELTWGFVKTFEMLDRVVDELRRDRSRTKLAQAVTMYHFVVEATLAQPGQHFISDYLDRSATCCPASARACATWRSTSSATSASASSCCATSRPRTPRCPEAVAEQLRAVTPVSLAVFVPPGWDTRYVECFGFTLEQIYEEGARSFEAKFRAAGPADRVAARAADHADGPAGRASAPSAAWRCCATGFLGERNGPPARDPEAMAVLFDSIRRNVDMRRAPDGPFVLQWEFPDAEPWHVRLDNGVDRRGGRAGRRSVDLELRCRFDDWVDVVAGRLDPRRAVATGRLQAARHAAGAVARPRPVRVLKLRRDRDRALHLGAVDDAVVLVRPGRGEATRRRSWEAASTCRRRACPCSRTRCRAPCRRPRAGCRTARSGTPCAGRCRPGR